MEENMLPQPWSIYLVLPAQKMINEYIQQGYWTRTWTLSVVLRGTQYFLVPFTDTDFKLYMRRGRGVWQFWFSSTFATVAGVKLASPLLSAL